MARIQLTSAIVLAVFGLAFAQFSNQFGAQPQHQQQYQQFAQQQQQRSASCPEANGTYPVAGQCDAYIECKNGVAEEKLCADGLLFNDKLGPNHFPCQYPIDVNCETRSRLQPAQATDECPHQFGYFKMGDRVNCGQFMNCVNGRGFTFDCPEGLAFSQETYRCEWPDMVSDCDAEAFVGFTCPPEARTDTVTHFNFYRHGQDCQVYYVCIEGRPRMYRCMEGKVFDTLTNTCEAAENVTTCGNTAAYRVQPKPVAIQQTQPRVVPTPAPVVVQQSQYYQQTTQKPFQFQQFAQTTAAPAPRTQFNGFSAFQQRPQPAPVQQQEPAFLKIAQQFVAQPTAAPAPAPAPKLLVQVEEDPYSFIQPRLGSGVEQAPVQPQYTAFSQTPRTTQPESPLPQTRSQITNTQFNFRSTGRGQKRYQAGFQ